MSFLNRDQLIQVLDMQKYRMDNMINFINYLTSYVNKGIRKEICSFIETEEICEGILNQLVASEITFEEFKENYFEEYRKTNNSKYNIINIPEEEDEEDDDEEYEEEEDDNLSGFIVDDEEEIE